MGTAGSLAVLAANTEELLTMNTHPQVGFSLAVGDSFLKPICLALYYNRNLPVDNMSPDIDKFLTTIENESMVCSKALRT